MGQLINKPGLDLIGALTPYADSDFGGGIPINNFLPALDFGAFSGLLNPTYTASSPVQTTLPSILSGIGSLLTPSTGSGSGGGLTGSGLFAGIGSLLGPVGTLVGGVVGSFSSLIPGFEGFLSSGFNFSCLGASSFKKADLDNGLNALRTLAESVDQNNPQKVCDFLNHCMRSVQEANLELPRYSNTCARNLHTKLRDAFQQTYDSVDKSPFKTSVATGHDWKGVAYSYTLLSPNGQGSSALNLQNMTPERFETELKPQIEAYALQNGLDVNQSLQTAWANLFPSSPPYASGTISVDGNGNVDWNVSAGNTKPNYLMYGALALGGLFAFKMLKK